MARKRHKPEEIVAKLRQVEVLTAQGKSVAEAIRSIGVTEVTFYRWPIMTRSGLVPSPPRPAKMRSKTPSRLQRMKRL